MQSNQSDGSMYLPHRPRHRHLHLNARQNWLTAHLRMRSARAATLLHYRPSHPLGNFTLCTGNSYSHGPWRSFLCLLMSFVLVLPSDCVGEPCMVPVGDITTAKLCLNRGLVRQCKGLYLSLKPTSFSIF